MFHAGQLRNVGKITGFIQQLRTVKRSASIHVWASAATESSTQLGVIFGIECWLKFHFNIRVRRLKECNDFSVVFDVFGAPTAQHQRHLVRSARAAGTGETEGKGN